MRVESAQERERLGKRLRRIEGQVRGVQRMIDEGRDCREIVQQLAAVQAAVQQTRVEVMRIYASQCLSDPNQDNQAMLDYLVNTLGRWA